MSSERALTTYRLTFASLITISSLQTIMTVAKADTDTTLWCSPSPR
jgi:hypothetical protein